ncbi:MAG TPA: WcaF family extracellular polysaccharide biosynthesis acetyltransferase [Gammaproteobacteria bacterium]|nr:WcaF family extracellular polysaccharide biosynthesis acetyltransferase [Gammaproteobacteria bacterium]
MDVNLKDYDNNWYRPGAGVLKRTLWYVTNALIFDAWWFPFSGVKCTVLRRFGARVGRGVVIKPRVNIKYPWNLVAEDNVWLGEGVWIDNLAPVRIGSDVCISQGALLLTGNHDYRDPKFALVLGEIQIEAGAWIGARAVVCPGVHIARGVVVTVNSVLTAAGEEGGIYQGNPARRVRGRWTAGADQPS